MTGWEFKNCVVQALGGMSWCLKQIIARWLVQYYSPIGIGSRRREVGGVLHRGKIPGS